MMYRIQMVDEFEEVCWVNRAKLRLCNRVFQKENPINWKISLSAAKDVLASLSPSGCVERAPDEEDDRCGYETYRSIVRKNRMLNRKMRIPVYLLISEYVEVRVRQLVNIQMFISFQMSALRSC